MVLGGEAAVRCSSSVGSVTLAVGGRELMVKETLSPVPGAVRGRPLWAVSGNEGISKIIQFNSIYY